MNPITTVDSIETWIGKSVRSSDMIKQHDQGICSSSMIKQRDQCCWSFLWSHRGSSCSAQELQEHSVAPDATIPAQLQRPGPLQERAVVPGAAVTTSWSVAGAAVGPEAAVAASWLVKVQRLLVAGA